MAHVNNADKKELQRILLKLQDIDNKIIAKTEKKQLQFNASVMNIADIYRAVNKVVKLPETQLIENIKSNQDVSDLYPIIQKRINVIPTFQLINILENMLEYKTKNADIYYQKFENEFQRRLKKMNFEEIANILNVYAFSNRANRQFFRDIENELLEREFEYIPIQLVGKILQGFSFSNLGCSMLYNTIAKSITLVQYEESVMNLAKYAYLFSKASENMKAGFGVYHIAEKRILQKLNTLEFNQLIKICKYLLSQNIGSNDFLKKFEAKLYDSYPSQIDPSHLVKICKYTSKYYFQYNDRALYHKIESDCIKYLNHMTNVQISEVLWSFSRGRLGNNILYSLLQDIYLNRIKNFKPRQLAFGYFGFCYAGRANQQILSAFESQILEIGLQKFDGHYIIKMLNAMNIINKFSSDLFKAIIKEIQQIHQTLKYNEMINLLYTIVEAPPFFLSKQKEGDEQLEKFYLFDEYQKLFEKFQEKIKSSVSILRVDEQCQLYYAYAIFNCELGQYQNIYDDLVKYIQPTSVPKQLFCKYLYAITEQLHLGIATEFLPFLDDLRTYGEIQYFFSHEDYIKLIWASSILQEVSSEYKINKKIFLEAYDSLFQINPNTLKFSCLKYYIQSLQLLSQKMSVVSKDEKDLLQKMNKKIEEISEHYKKEFLERDLGNKSAINTEMIEILNENVSFLDNYQIVPNFVDSLLNTIDIAFFYKENNLKQEEAEIQKIGFLIFQKYYYRQQKQGDLQNLLMYYQIKCSILQDFFGWKIITIDEDEWVKSNNEQKKRFISDNVLNLMPNINMKSKRNINQEKDQDVYNFNSENEQQIEENRKKNSKKVNNFQQKLEALKNKTEDN